MPFNVKLATQYLTGVKTIPRRHKKRLLKRATYSEVAKAAKTTVGSLTKFFKALNQGGLEGVNKLRWRADRKPKQLNVT